MFRDGGEMRQTVITLQKELGDAVRACVQKYGPEAWYQNTLLALASELQLAAVELFEGDNHAQVTRVAWAARNLLELYYFVRYVLSSEENARRFHEDALCDYRDMMKWMAKVPGIEALLKVGQDKIAELSGSLEQTDEQDSYLKAANIANTFKEDFPFGMANKFLSKFVHPTSLSIQLRLQPEADPVMRGLMVQTGMNYIEHTFPQLAAELRTLHPKAEQAAT
jgi:hypothetical protein